MMKATLTRNAEPGTRNKVGSGQSAVGIHEAERSSLHDEGKINLEPGTRNNSRQWAVGSHEVERCSLHDEDKITLNPEP